MAWRVTRGLGQAEAGNLVVVVDSDERVVQDAYARSGPLAVVGPGLGLDGLVGMDPFGVGNEPGIG